MEAHPGTKCVLQGNWPKITRQDFVIKTNIKQRTIGLRMADGQQLIVNTYHPIRKGCLSGDTQRHSGLTGFETHTKGFWRGISSDALNHIPKVTKKKKKKHSKWHSSVAIYTYIYYIESCVYAGYMWCPGSHTQNHKEQPTKPKSSLWFSKVPTADTIPLVQSPWVP